MAKKIQPQNDDRGELGGARERQSGERRPVEGGSSEATAGRWRQPPLRPTRAPGGEVRWWERPAPEDSELRLWQAVQRIQARRLQLGITVTDLAARLQRIGHSMRRETLSRVLNGKQPTTWETAQRLGEILGVDVHRRGSRPDAQDPS